MVAEQEFARRLERIRDAAEGAEQARREAEALRQQRAQ